MVSGNIARSLDPASITSPEYIKVIKSAASATKSEAAGRIVKVKRYEAVESQITVKGQLLDTLLSLGSFNKSLKQQIAYAKKLGYRLATREENMAYVKILLGKDAKGSINTAEFKALRIYRNMYMWDKRYVRDSQGALRVFGDDIVGYDRDWRDVDVPHGFALFVRDSEESE